MGIIMIERKKEMYKHFIGKNKFKREGKIHCFVFHIEKKRSLP